jgi:hypothetical protein
MLPLTIEPAVDELVEDTNLWCKSIKETKDIIEEMSLMEVEDRVNFREMMELDDEKCPASAPVSDGEI